MMRWTTIFKNWLTSIEPSSRREIWAGIVLAAVFGLPYLDAWFITPKIVLRTYYDEAVCQQLPKKCWIQFNK
jgi:hypothetical protein